MTDRKKPTVEAKGADLAAAGYDLRNLLVESYGEPTDVVRVEDHHGGVSLYASDGEVWEVDADGLVILCAPVAVGDRVEMQVEAVDADADDVERTSPVGAMATVTAVGWGGKDGWSVALQVDDGPFVHHAMSDPDLRNTGGVGLGFVPKRTRPLTVIWQHDTGEFTSNHVDYDEGDPYELAVRAEAAHVGCVDEADREDWVRATMDTIQRVAVFEGHARVADDLVDPAPTTPTAPGM